MKNKMIARLCKLLGVSHSSNDWFLVNQGLSGASWAGLKTVVKYLNKLKGGQK